MNKTPGFGLQRARFIGALLLMVVMVSFTSGCTVDDPGYVNIANTPEVQVVDKDGDIINIDSATRDIVVLDHSHYEIHDGCSYLADINSDDLKVEGDNNALHIKMVIPQMDERVHLFYIVWAAGAADLSITEAPTGGAAGGDALTVYNRNRNSIKTSLVVVTQDDTAPTGGTEIHHEKVGAGKSIAGASGDRNEFILKSNTTYSFRLTSDVSARAQLTLNWYENTDRG